MILQNVDLICIDIDGVIRDITSPIKKVMYKRYKLLPTTEEYYELHKWYPSINKEEFYKYIFEYKVKDIFLKYANYYDKQDIVRLKQINEKTDIMTIFISKQEGKRIEITKQWLKKHLDNNYFDLPEYYVNNNNFKEKSDVVNKIIKDINLKTIIFIDDCISNLNDINNNVLLDKNQSIVKICVRRPWNLEWNGITIQSFKDIIPISKNNVKIIEYKK